MKAHNVKKIVYSSSSTVYGTPQTLPLTEDHPTGSGCTSPYGKSKYFVEQILKDIVTSDETWSVISLRYFNPVGAHESGKIGEDPKGIPNNIMPYIAQVAVGRRNDLKVFGNDYNTPDGTGGCTFQRGQPAMATITGLKTVSGADNMYCLCILS